jgi:hypothetical protein
MSQLVAHFEVELPGRCLVALPDEGDVSLDCTYKEFTIHIALIRSHASGAKEKDDKYWTRALCGAKLDASRHEIDNPPPVVPDEKGIRDYNIQAGYFRERIKSYAEAACQSINRVIRFFKYDLNTPYLAEFDLEDQCFQNAKWTNVDGEEVGKGAYSVIVPAMPGIWGDLGVKKLTPERLAQLQDALANHPMPTLFQQIQADARTALFERQVRRAVLELAIACEMLVKQSFFSEGTVSAASFEYLEDKSKVSVRVSELIDGVAKQAFGASFREDHPDHFKNIDHLYRCRNKVAHRGALSYRDDNGFLHDVDETVAKSWWTSVDQLQNWLSIQKTT